MPQNKPSFIWNPFHYIAGTYALLIGLTIMAASAIIGSYNNIVFDGVLDCHLTAVTMKHALLYVALDWLVLVCVVGIATLLMKLKYRFIDLAGTLALARAPFLILAILGVIATPISADTLLEATGNPFTVGTIIFMICTIPVVIWSIVLIYNAIKVSCDLKGKYLTLICIMGILVAEVIIKVIEMKWIL